MDYIENLKQSFNLWYKNKYLWLIGMIAALFAGGQSLNFNGSGDNSTIANETNFSEDKWLDSIRSIPVETWWIIGIVFILLILLWICLGIYLQNTADSALIKSFQSIKNNEEMNFKKSWALGNKYWLKLFLQKLIVYLPIITFVILILIVVSIALYRFFNGNGLENNDYSGLVGILVLFYCGICLMILIQIPLTIIFTFSQRIMILEDKGIKDSILSGYGFVMSNFSKVVISWFVSWVLGIVQTIIAFMVGIIILIATIFVILIIFKDLLLGLVLLLLLIVLASIINAVALGPIYALISIYWTNTYTIINELNKQKEE